MGAGSPPQHASVWKLFAEMLEADGKMQCEEDGLLRWKARGSGDSGKPELQENAGHFRVRVAMAAMGQSGVRDVPWKSQPTPQLPSQDMGRREMVRA